METLPSNAQPPASPPRPADDRVAVELVRLVDDRLLSGTLRSSEIHLGLALKPAAAIARVGGR